MVYGGLHAKIQPNMFSWRNCNRRCEVLQQQFYFVYLVIEYDRTKDEVKPGHKILTIYIKSI